MNARRLLLAGGYLAWLGSWFWGVLAGWVAIVRRGGRLAFEADEAMGHGLVFLLCAAVVLAAALVVPLVLAGVALGRRFSPRRRGAAARTGTPGR